MKKILSLILIFPLLISLTACQQEQTGSDNTVTFYYLRREYTYGSHDGVLSGETRNTTSQGSDPVRLLTLYFMGPKSEDLRSPFPIGVRLVSYKMVEQTAYVTLSDSMSQLTGIDLTLACACVAKTVMRLTGAQAVHIEAEKASLGNSQSIVMDEATLLLYDGSDSNK